MGAGHIRGHHHRLALFHPRCPGLVLCDRRPVGRFIGEDLKWRCRSCQGRGVSCGESPDGTADGYARGSGRDQLARHPQPGRRHFELHELAGCKMAFKTLTESLRHVMP